MALTCARCGAQNADGNVFCQVCGTPIAAPAPAQGFPSAPPSAPGFAAASATYAASPGYQSPYYAPAAAGRQVSVHRTPWLLIVGAVAVLVVLMAGGGTAVALLRNQVPNSNSSSNGIAPVPSPSPADSPSPAPSPTAITGPTASNEGATVPLPAGWIVESKDSQSITISDPSGAGAITIGSGASNPNETAQQNKATVDKFFTAKYPDATACPNSRTSSGSLAGATGIFWELCFTLISGAQSFQAAAAMFAGANADGSVYYVVVVLTSKDNLASFVNETAAVLAGIQWKLK